ncbi:Hypothetical protein NTJ_09469 [Nesidiocoris tenuis]|uniref:WD repeat-containing protein 75 second beta-propeller domain-containing protein n=1 Tax=Nesidiocoris tenuis TaxID=355587 RepID=A0ABN7AWT8_9HEMI|nr:Hypothetical protein NTJ_09469 [Nesidiocoris tenuis]
MVALVNTSLQDAGAKNSSERRVLPDRPSVTTPERNDGYTKTRMSQVTVRRRGGGTIIESRPVFSDDAKYLYVNCGWGVRVFSLETGECARVFDAHSQENKVVDCFCWKSLPSALTSEGVFIAWNPRSGKVEHKVRLSVDPSKSIVGGFFIAPDNIASSQLCLIMETKHESTLKFYSGQNFRSINHPLNDKQIGHPYNLHTISYGGPFDEPFIAYIHDKLLKIVDMRNVIIVKGRNAGNSKRWTCVRCHPTENTVAAGDSLGRIVVFRNVKRDESGNCNVVQSFYHWHTLPVQEIAFSPAGSSLYSGGGELVLVKWNMDNPNVRNYLPRLSADIVHINISPYNHMTAVATLDNGIQIVSPNNKLQCVLQQLSWSVFAGEHEGMFPAGLLYDSVSRGLILNGRPGHLQLYSPLSETLTLNIDVTRMNYLTQERDKVIVNTHVTHSAITTDGQWLATVETRRDTNSILELKLKFWQYIAHRKRYNLTTVIDMPHDEKVHSIRFSPCPPASASHEDVQPENEVILVTTGGDRRARLWTKVPFDSIYQKGNTWRCQNTCSYRDRPCGPCCFSYDGSLLSIGFGSALTLWDAENVVLKESITCGSDPLRFVEFASDDCCNILMVATDIQIMAWDLLTLSLAWKIDLKAALFVADPYSAFLAVFTKDNKWNILQASNGEIVYSMDNSGKTETGGNRPSTQQVLAAVFVPRHRPICDAPSWMRNSYLYYVDVYQELNCLEPANEIEQLPTFQLAMDKEVATLFGSLVGAKTVKENQDEDSSVPTVGFGVLGSKAVTRLLRPAAHTLPPVSLLCGSLLQSFTIMKRESESGEIDREDRSEDDKTTVVASSDSDSDFEMTPSSLTTKFTRVHGKSPQKSPKKPSQKSDERSGFAAETRMDVDPPGDDLRKLFPIDDNDYVEDMFVIED